MTAKSGASWQAEYWNGDAGRRWARYQAQVDRALRPFGEAMIDAAALRSGQQVLDVGCGCGGTTFSAARRVAPTGKVVGLDISSPMIERAREQSVGNHTVEFVCADATSYSFEQQFDALLSRYGLMFFEDPVAALQHLRKSLKGAGKLSFAAWRTLAENDWLSVPLRVVQKALNLGAETSPQHGPSPFAFSNPDYVREVLLGAGFTSIDIRAFEAPVRMSESGLPEAVAFVQLHAGPVGRLLSEVDHQQKARAVAALEHHLAERVRGDIVELQGAAWLVTAAAP